MNRHNVAVSFQGVEGGAVGDEKSDPDFVETLPLPLYLGPNFGSRH
jgi:hypothetical protein